MKLHAWIELALLSACALKPDGTLSPNLHKDPELAQLGERSQTVRRVCARGRSDSFAVSLCQTLDGVELTGMSDLLRLAGLHDQRAFALTANSTSLAARATSVLNPRLIVFPRVAPDQRRPPQLTVLGFVRGDRFVEIASRDATGQLNFYLLSFERACDYEASGCDLMSLLSEEIEHDWTAYSLYDQDDLEPTSFDCLSCHAPGNAGSQRILRMQELVSPWMHWFPQRFVQQTESDRALTAIFVDMHEHDRQYGGIPVATIADALDEGSGAQLEALLRAEGHDDQPNPFDARIAAEMASGVSATWQARFEAHLRGEAIAVPYPRIDVTDEAKRDAAVRSYLDVVTGAAARSTLLDVRDVFSDDAALKLSFLPQPAADGVTVLRQMCARCHDGRGDPRLAKSRFDVLRLDNMSQSEKALAIARILAGDETRMPPRRAGTLTPEAKQAAIAELSK